jgi:hypothetical protein
VEIPAQSSSSWMSIVIGSHSRQAIESGWGTRRLRCTSRQGKAQWPPPWSYGHRIQWMERLCISCSVIHDHHQIRRQIYNLIRYFGLHDCGDLLIWQGLTWGITMYAPLMAFTCRHSSGKMEKWIWAWIICPIYIELYLRWIVSKLRCSTSHLHVNNTSLLPVMRGAKER